MEAAVWRQVLRGSARLIWTSLARRMRNSFLYYSWRGSVCVCVSVSVCVCVWLQKKRRMKQEAVVWWEGGRRNRWPGRAMGGGRNTPPPLPPQLPLTDFHWWAGVFVCVCDTYAVARHHRERQHPDNLEFTHNESEKAQTWTPTGTFNALTQKQTQSGETSGTFFLFRWFAHPPPAGRMCVSWVSFGFFVL